MSIITFSVVNGEVSYSTSFIKELNMNEDEAVLAEQIISVLATCNIDMSKVEMVRKSNDYLTVVFNGNEWSIDLVRFKFTSRAKWVAIQMSEKQCAELLEDERFAAQKNKRQSMWKSKLKTVDDAKPLVELAYKSLLDMQDKFPEYR